MRSAIRCLTWFVVVAPLSLIWGSGVAAQLPVEVEKIIAGDAAANARFGNRVALSRDVMVLGAPGADVAYVYRRIDARWQEEQVLSPADPDPGARFGGAVAIDSGGRRVLVGAAAHGESGRAYVFDLVDGVWTETRFLSPLAGSDHFGAVVALDGDTAVVTALLEGGTGAVYVYEFVDGGWIRVRHFNNGLFHNHSFGESLAVDGEWIVAGDPPVAQVVIYRKIAGEWQRFDTLNSVGGYSLAVDGETLLSGFLRGSSASEVVVCRFNGSSWSEVQRVSASDSKGAQDAFGAAVAARDGFAVIGASLAPGGGAAYVFTEESGFWSEVARITPSTGAPVTNRFGISLGVSRDSVLVGVDRDDEAGSDTGAAFVYLRGKVLAGNVDIGNGSPRANVMTLNGETGGAERLVQVTAGAPATLDIGRAPASVRGAYAVWVVDGGVTAGAPILRKRGARTFKLGTGPACLPITNSVAPGMCPCPSVVFPRGWTSKGLGTNAAARFCVNERPGFPLAPTSFELIFPVGDFLIGCLVEDRNSFYSPDYDVSVGNWIRVESR